MRVYLESLGCRLNAAELETLAREFAGAGDEVIPTPDGADLVVLNTCAVTAQAARKSRHRLRTLHRRAPQARLAAVGCWATDEAEAAAQLPGVAWVIPNSAKLQTVTRLGRSPAAPTPWSPGQWGHTRAFIGVQDGCDEHCTYCVTRRLRGPASSRPLAEVIATVQERVDGGAQEVVLTGVCLGSYGHDLGLEGGLATLVEAVLRETALPRLRLSSVEPWDVDERLLRQWENPRLCRQLHLPLQAGHDATLRRMGRRITTARFAALVAAARAITPDLAVTTDLIAGFPGETEEEFAATLAFVAALGFARLHVFPYSERKGTPAVQLPDQVPPPVRAQRAAQLAALGDQLAAAYRVRFLGQTLPVLWEQRDAAGRWHGLTDTYLEVVTESEADLYNHLTPTRLVAVEGEILRGVVEKRPQTTDHRPPE